MVKQVYSYAVVEGINNVMNMGNDVPNVTDVGQEIVQNNDDYVGVEKTIKPTHQKKRARKRKRAKKKNMVPPWHGGPSDDWPPPSDNGLSCLPSLLLLESFGSPCKRR